jgi:protein arginine kinase activator
VNGSLSEAHLCQQCAHELKLNGLSYPVMVAGFLQSLLGASAAHAMQEAGQETSQGAAAKDVCPTCHITSARIQRSGFVGCGDCYEHFAGRMDKWLRRIQGQGQHEGKVPKRYAVEFQEAADLENLKLKLKHCIEQEDFEEAALLRDRIRELEILLKGESRC